MTTSWHLFSESSQSKLKLSSLSVRARKLLSFRQYRHLWNSWTWLDFVQHSIPNILCTAYWIQWHKYSCYGSSHQTPINLDSFIFTLVLPFHKDFIILIWWWNKNAFALSDKGIIDRDKVYSKLIATPNKIWLICLFLWFDPSSYSTYRVEFLPKILVQNTVNNWVYTASQSYHNCAEEVDLPRNIKMFVKTFDQNNH